MSSRPAALPAPGSPDALYVVDFMGYVFRAYHAIAPLTSPAGEPTHATFGTVAMLQKLIADRKPTYLAVVLDSPGARVRTEMDPRYKAHRPPPPDDLVTQILRAQEFVGAYQIPTFSADGLEADDVIAALVHRARGLGMKVVIASSDKDLMQLVEDDGVLLWDAMRDKVYGTDEVTEKFGVPPAQLRDLLALVGDTSDNVPGVPGIGPKTAAELLHQFGSFDGIYAHLDDIKKPRIRDSLKEHQGEAELSRRLVTLQPTPVDVTMDSLRYRGADQERLRQLFTELGFTRLLKALPPAEPRVKRSAAACEMILEQAALTHLAERLGQAKEVAVAVLGTSDDSITAHVYAFAFSTEEGPPAYVPVGHRYLGAPKQLTIADVQASLGPFFANPALHKIAHDAKYCHVLLARHGIDLAGVVMDTMLAAYLLDPEGPTSLEVLGARDGGMEAPQESGPAGKRRRTQEPPDGVEVQAAAALGAWHVGAELALAERYTSRLRLEKLDKLLVEMELPLSLVLSEMERTGTLVDLSVLADLGAVMTSELDRLETQAHAVAGRDFNLGSPKQLEAMLFDVLGLKSTKKTKTGRSTDAEVLEALADDHALPGIVLEHRAIAKLKGTYVDALPRLINSDTGRIHTRWSQAVAATGRISSQDPNLQNIPIRTDLGKLIRRAFIAPPGMVLVSADYSQIELRVLAHLSRDPVLVEAFKNGEDVHARTAMEVFGVPASGVTDEMRRRSKAINFGVIYGMGESALAKRLGISRAEAAQFIDAYFERYRGVREFMTKTMAEARRSEAVFTAFGRRRPLPDLRSTDRQRRAQAERIAQNTPIQGTAADLLKLAMLRLAKPVVPGVRMVLTVHDELVFEVPEDVATAAIADIRQAMESVYPMEVPLVVSVSSGRTWADT